jgi:hypothetical protein
MEVSRRNALRLVGGAAGTAGIASAGLVSGPGLLPSAGASTSRKIIVHLDSRTYRSGQRMTLRVHESFVAGRKLRIHDTNGHVGKRIARSKNLHVFRATAKNAGVGKITVMAVWPDGRVVHNARFRDSVSYEVYGAPHLATAGASIIGMSSPSGDWDKRVSEVGVGLAARRIFADLGAGATSQLKLVEQAHNAGMLPVISYKTGGDPAGAASGRFNAVAEQAATRLASYGLPTAVTFWHEPYGDMTGAQYATASRQLVPIFKRGELKVGPLLNGWLLDNKLSTFASFAPDDLLHLWDWFGIDTYESGTMTSPGKNKPADRVPKMASFLQSRGVDLPLGVGEYNGYSSTTIAAAGEALMSTPNVWFGCMWNSNGGKGNVLTGERLTAFQRTLADPRSAAPRST